MTQGSRIALLLASFATFTQQGHAQTVTQKTEGACSPAVTQVTGNVSIICNGDHLNQYQQSVKAFSDLVNTPGTNQQQIREYIKAHLDLINGSYIAPEGHRNHAWSARQTFHTLPPGFDAIVKPD